jgi:hypothetical protein
MDSQSTPQSPPEPKVLVLYVHWLPHRRTLYVRLAASGLGHSRETKVEEQPILRRG